MIEFFQRTRTKDIFRMISNRNIDFYSQQRNFYKERKKKRLRWKNLTQNKFRSSRSDYSYRSTFSQSADTPIASFTWFIYQVEETNIRAQFPFTRVEEMEKSSRILLLLRDFNQSTEITSILQKRLKLLKRCIDWLIRDTCVTGYQVTREKARFACKIDGYRFKKNLKSHANSPVLATPTFLHFQIFHSFLKSLCLKKSLSFEQIK